MPRTKSKSGHYFTEETQNAIIEYNSTTDSELKNRIYQERIYPAFNTLTEVLIRHYGFSDLDTDFNNLKGVLLSFLTEILSKYKTENGKAFSYFTVCGRNHLILLKKKKANNNQYIDIEQITPEDEIVLINAEENLRDTLQFFEEFVEYMETKLSTYFIGNDLPVADALMVITKSRYDFEKLNKKIVFFMIRQICGEDTPALIISGVIHKFNKIYRYAHCEYDRHGYLNKNKVYAIY